MRPIVSVEIVNIENVYNLIVRNTGLTAAFDVKINVSPPMRINLNTTLNGDIPFLKYPIPYLQSGGEFKCAFIAGYDNLKRISKELLFSFEVEYSDRDGGKFNEKQNLDVRLIAEAAVLRETGMKEVVAGIVKVEKAILKIAEEK